MRPSFKTILEPLLYALITFATNAHALPVDLVALPTPANTSTSTPADGDPFWGPLRLDLATHLLVYFDVFSAFALLVYVCYLFKDEWDEWDE